MIEVLWLLAFAAVAVQGSEKVFVPLVPEAVKFTSSQTIKSSQLADVLSGILGYSVDTDDPWHGLAPVIPFNSPRVAVVLDFDGYDGDTVLDVSGPSFPLENDADLETQMQVLSDRTNKRFADKTPVVFYMRTGEKLYEQKRDFPEFLLPISPDTETRLAESAKDADLSKALRDGIFNASLSGDDRFLTELYTSAKVVEQVGKHAPEDGSPVVTWLKLGGLRDIFDRYLEESYQASHAQRLIRTFIDRAKKILAKSHGQNAILIVITQNDRSPALIRKGRSLLEEPVRLAEETHGPKMAKIVGGVGWNLATETDPDFHVAFALVAFVSIMLILLVFGISIGLWFIDPGRDSIIYRLTLQRAKRD